MDSNIKNDPHRKIALVLSLLSAVFAAVGGAVWGSATLVIISGVFLAFAICKTKNAIWLLSLPISYILALIFSGDFLLSLTVLLCLPVVFALWFCVAKKKSISATVAVLSFAAAISVGILFTVWTVQTYNQSVVESYKLYLADIKEFWKAITDYMAGLVNDEGIQIISPEAIEFISENTKMTLPAVLIITVELLAYGAAKLFRLMTIILRAEELVPTVPWKVKVLAPTSFLCTLAYIVLFFMPLRSIGYYVCVNLLYILLPMAAISGFHSVFGIGGIFRRSSSCMPKAVIIAMFALFLFVDPTIILITFVMWESFDTVRNYLISKKKDSDSNNDDNYQ